MSEDDTPDVDGILNADRRGLLKGLAAAGGAGLLGSAGLTGSASATHAGHVTEADIDQHIDLRQAAHQDSEDTLVNHACNCYTSARNHDEQFETTAPSPSGETVVPWVYSKALGTADTDAPAVMVSKSEHEAVDGVLDDLLAGGSFSGDGDPSASDIPSDRRRPLVSMASAVSVTTEGTDAWLPSMPPAPDYDSPRTYAEMLEVYAMSLLRDKPFPTFGDDTHDVQWALLNDFNNLVRTHENFDDYDWEWFQGIDENGNFDFQYLFRDPFYGCDRGPYASQIWYHDVPIGGVTANMKVEPITGVLDPANDDCLDENAPALNHLDRNGPPFGLTDDAFEEMMHTRSGAEPEHDPAYQVSVARDSPEWVHSGRGLGSQVRDDPAYQPYLLAALQLLGEWGVPLKDDLPYNPDNETQYAVDQIHPYIDFGAVGLLDILARVCRNALISSWKQKWYVHRRLRPETYADRIERGGFDLDDGLLDGNVLRKVRSHNESAVGERTAYLPQLYPEGAPAHPAYPSGHSVIAGACSTVLKTFFQNRDLTDPELCVQPKVPETSGDGVWLNDYDGGDLTVHGEINKFASNVGMARIWAGVHYRTDHLYGMLLGQQVAVATLWDHFTNNVEEVNGTVPGNSFPDSLPVHVHPFRPDGNEHPFPEPTPMRLTSRLLGKLIPITRSGPV